MSRVYWFCTSPYPALPYTGFYAHPDKSEYLRSLYLIRAGQIHKAVSLPENLPNMCYGDQESGRWGTPAIYRKRGNGIWTGLTLGSESRWSWVNYPTHTGSSSRTSRTQRVEPVSISV